MIASTTQLALFWLAITAMIVYLAYDWLREASASWLAENDVLYPVYPWYVRFDHWLYHRELCRIQNLAFEQHRLFGTRLRILGQYVTTF